MRPIVGFVKMVVAGLDAGRVVWCAESKMVSRAMCGRCGTDLV